MAKTAKSRRPADRYCDYSFRVRWDGQLIAGVSHVSALARIAEVVEYREGGSPNAMLKIPGRIEFEPITLERGLTTDPAFEAWATQVSGGGTTLAKYHKDVRIDVYDAANRLALAFDIRRCWPSRYAVVTGLDASPSCCLIESLTLEHEGWKRVALPRRR
jgi:phage tail-like protein